MSDCARYRELISLLTDGELTAEQESSLRTHIETCAGCKRVYEAFTGLSEAISENMAEPPEMLAKGVMLKARNQKKHWRFAYGKFTALAACLAIILFSAAKFGYLGNDGSYLSMNAAQTESLTDTSTGGAESGSGMSGMVPKAATQKPSREDIKKGVKLETSEDGTVYQLGFPIQNFEVLSGAKPEEVKKEPDCLLNAKQLTVYKGEWYSDEELADRSSGADKVRNVRVTDVSDKDTLDNLGILLTSVPNDTNGLTVDSKEFSDSNPVYTLYIPAQKQPDASDDKSADAKGTENKTGALKNGIGSLKNSFLKKAEDSTKKTEDGPKASPSPSASDDRMTTDSAATQKPVHERNVTISIWYVNGEIWCVVEPVDETDSELESPDPSAKTDADKTKTEAASPEVSPSVTDKADKSATATNSASPTEKTSGHLFSRILYKAAGTPEKLDVLMKKLTGAGEIMRTEDNIKK